MRIPYSCVASHGETVFASRGGQIQSFNLRGGPALTTWNHPEAAREAAASVASAGDNVAKIPRAPSAEALAEGDEPPAKRQRSEPETAEKPAPAEEAGASDAPREEDDEKAGGKGRKKKDSGGRAFVGRGPFTRRSEHHIIVILEVSADGKHVAAVSGLDKTLWMFEHDGSGALNELSKRPMPKRPSSVSFSPGGKAILVADKFGDVYALPVDEADSLSTEITSLAVKHRRDPNKPTANAHTVHSKINLRSLEMQHRHLERLREKATPAAELPKKSGEPAFEHTLVVGHVSMLTGVLVREYEGRRYIVTCDRDEHIRVSRYMPQNYVIEAFCLGHKEYVNSLAVSEAYPRVLVSGGGDDALFVWDWLAGTLLSKADILSHARRVSEVQHVAVSKVVSSTAGVFAICEGIPAVFQWTLSAAPHTLDNCRPVRLPGNPLDISIQASPELTTMLVAVDTQGSEESPLSLLAYAPADKECTSWTPRAETFDESAAEGALLEVSPPEVKSLLYNVGSLRKTAWAPDGVDQEESV